MYCKTVNASDTVKCRLLSLGTDLFISVLLPCACMSSNQQNSGSEQQNYHHAKHRPKSEHMWQTRIYNLRTSWRTSKQQVQSNESNPQVVSHWLSSLSRTLSTPAQNFTKTYSLNIDPTFLRLHPTPFHFSLSSNPAITWKSLHPHECRDLSSTLRHNSYCAAFQNLIHNAQYLVMPRKTIPYQCM